ncbi:hypothetical protein GALL_533450 [mine drainage metagenome]|uniref:Uncharacterized protein n=1 Tax=mine drainage metagenome TaxID=410659 RepID=A0A1J5PC72_9ZZZZ
MLMEVFTPRWPAMARLPRLLSTTTWGVRVARVVKLRPRTGRLSRLSGEMKAAALARSESTLEVAATTSTTALVSGARRMVKGAASPRFRVTLTLLAVWKPALVTVTE